MKIDPVVARETRYVAGVCVILSVMMQAVFLCLSFAGVMAWHWLFLPGNLLGFLAAVGNFFLMGLTVQNATQLEEKDAKTRMRASYALRSVLLVVVCILAAVTAKLTGVTGVLFAAVLPLLFPRIAFALRQFSLNQK